jgi:hypothetical protein
MPTHRRRARRARDRQPRPATSTGEGIGRAADPTETVLSRIGNSGIRRLLSADVGQGGGPNARLQTSVLRALDERRHRTRDPAVSLASLGADHLAVRSAGEEDAETSDLSEAAESTSISMGSASDSSSPSMSVDTILRPGWDPATSTSTSTQAPGDGLSGREIVAPSGSPNVDSAASENTCTPDPAGTQLTWEAVRDGDNWRANVKSLRLKGQINIKPWRSAPTSATVPNTANPGDGGNITNDPGNNKWDYAISDMADYDNATGGGAGPHWHSTAASRAHEWAHWDGDYLGDAVTGSTGGNWRQINREIDALVTSASKWAGLRSVSKSDAEAALRPQVERRFRTWRDNTLTRWNSLIGTTDKAGKGGRGFAAGMRVLNGLIDSVRAYADAKGWRGGGASGPEGTSEFVPAETAP